MEVMEADITAAMAADIMKVIEADMKVIEVDTRDIAAIEKADTMRVTMKATEIGMADGGAGALIQMETGMEISLLR